MAGEWRWTVSVAAFQRLLGPLVQGFTALICHSVLPNPVLKFRLIDLEFLKWILQKLDCNTGNVERSFRRVSQKLCCMLYLSSNLTSALGVDLPTHQSESHIRGGT